MKETWFSEFISIELTPAKEHYDLYCQICQMESKNLRCWNRSFPQYHPKDMLLIPKQWNVNSIRHFKMIHIRIIFSLLCHFCDKLLSRIGFCFVLLWNANAILPLFNPHNIGFIYYQKLYTDAKADVELISSCSFELSQPSAFVVLRLNIRHLIVKSTGISY